MKFVARALEKRAIIYFVIFFLVAGGITSFFYLGWLEDPEFTIKTAVISTSYPGASPKEVELEVTDRIEKAVQELPELDKIYSLSRAGQSMVVVDIKQNYWFDTLPQVWDNMRKKIREATPLLPPGVRQPQIDDSFSFVYGFVLIVTGDGFSYAELEEHADMLKKELSLVEGVARVELWGTQDKVIYLDVAEKQLSSLGISAQTLVTTLQKQNMVVDAGSVDFQGRRIRIAPTGSFSTPEEIGELAVYPPGSTSVDRPSAPSGGELFKIKDIATVRRGYREPARTLLRYNGQPALAISVANVSGGNIIDTGRNIEARLSALQPLLPVGIELRRLAWQSGIVDSSIRFFMKNLMEAVIIVLVVLTIFMGWRTGLIIGIDLALTILGTFIFMLAFHIDLQRMSLGALVIALGMIVDNSIVVADSFLVHRQQGMEKKEAAIKAASQPSLPLLSATLVTVMSFFPVFASRTNVGEYCGSLFTVIGISLMISWLIAVLVTPLQCIDMFPDNVADPHPPFSGPGYSLFRKFITRAIRYRKLTLACMLGMLVLAALGFGGVPQQFFMDSERPQFMIDYWAPEGTTIQQVADDLQTLEKRLSEVRQDVDFATFIGQGPPRFYLPIDPELPNPSYAQIVVNTKTFDDVESLIAELEGWVPEHMPQAMIRLRKFGLGPCDTWPFEAHFVGPGTADPGTLRVIGEAGMAILRKSPLAGDIQLDMRQRVHDVTPVYSQQRGRWANVTREDLARTTQRAYDGLQVGLYREQDDLYPILVRHTPSERAATASRLATLQIQPAGSAQFIPLAQVTDRIDLCWQDPIIAHFNRRRCCTVQASPKGVTFPTLQASVLKQFNDIKMPPGYELIWDGEHRSSYIDKSSLLPGLIPAGIAMVFVIISLFNAFRPMLIIICTIPFALIGITAGLLVSGATFGFMSILGAISLIGMMIRNAVVLLDQLNVEIRAGRSLYEGIINAAVARLRPVLLAGITVVLGVIPLLKDAFWFSISVTIMSGLAFGTILTVIVVPVLYAFFYRLRAPAAERHPLHSDPLRTYPK